MQEDFQLSVCLNCLVHLAFESMISSCPLANHLCDHGIALHLNLEGNWILVGRNISLLGVACLDPRYVSHSWDITIYLNFLIVPIYSDCQSTINSINVTTLGYFLCVFTRIFYVCYNLSIYADFIHISSLWCNLIRQFWAILIVDCDNW